ncbi:TPA: MFS transporter, partial [Streptococcus suis]
MIELVSRNKLYYYISLILVAISRSLPHSVLTVMFLDKGLRISDIVVIQAMYSLAVLIFEVPSGVWSDIYSRKKMYIVSSVLLIVVFLSAI